MPRDYIWTFLLGLLFAAALFAVVSVMEKKQKQERRYDERQLQARGRAYQAAFLSLLGYCVVVGMLSLYLERELCPVYTAMFIGVFFSAGVFAVKCIFSEAYFAVGERPGYWLALSALVVAINMVVILKNLHDGKAIIENGVLTEYSINVACGILFVAIFAATLIKTLKDRASDASER